MTRVAILDRKDMNAEQGKVYDDVKAEGGPLGGYIGGYLKAVSLALIAAQAIGAMAATKTTR